MPVGNNEHQTIDDISTDLISYGTVEPLLRDHPDERPPPLERPLNYVNLNINVLISTPDGRPPLLKGHFSGAKGVASQEGVPLYSVTRDNWFRIVMHELLCASLSVTMTFSFSDDMSF